MRPDRSKAEALKTEFYSTNQSSKEPILTKKKKLSPTTLKFIKKMDEELFSEFTNTEWIMYFQKKYKEANNGKGYQLIGDVAWRNERCIYNSLMKNFAPLDIKTMIDFLCDADHDMMPKIKIGAFKMSFKWIDHVYKDAMLWRNGAYMTSAQYKAKKAQENQPEKRNREWIPENTKSEEAVVLPKRKRKNTITF
jgi:hypothetical protein